MTRTEARIQAEIVHWLRCQGAIVIRVNSGKFCIRDRHGSRVVMGAPAGTADIIGCLPGGRFIAIEVKRPDGVLTDKQKRFLQSVADCGEIGRAHV